MHIFVSISNHESIFFVTERFVTLKSYKNGFGKPIGCCVVMFTGICAVYEQ